MRLNLAGGFIAAIIVVALIIAYGSIFTVHQTRQALVVRLGEPVRVVTSPGLHFKYPLIDSVIHIDKRILDLENPAQEVIASDQKRLVVDAFARWKVTDPLLFYQTVSTVEGANSRLSTLLNSALRRVLGENPLTQVVRDKRAPLMGQVREQLEREAKDFGIMIVDVRIRRADLPEQNSQAVYQRMQTERQQEAAQFRAQGSQRAQETRAKADREVTELLAVAEATAQATRGEGDGERNRIFADAFNRDPDFFSFYRAMQAYEAGLRGDTRMLLKPDSDFFRFFVDPSGRPRAGSTPGGTVGAQPGGRQTIAPAAQMRPRHHVRFHCRHRSGARHRRFDLRRLSGGGKAARSECVGDAGRLLADCWCRIGRPRCTDRVAGPGLIGWFIPA